MTKKGRELYLFDTFDGMSAPDAHDVRRTGWHAQGKYEQTIREDGGSDWCRAPLEDVQANMKRTGYPDEKIFFVKGKVEDTIPDAIPDEIAILRLDTDFYSSTRHELEHLYERLAVDGILLIDDYGAWNGCRKALPLLS